jgi:hypothetical protein
MRHKGVDVSIGQIAEETGFDRSQVQAAVAHLQKRNEVPIVTVVRGNVYRYTGEVAPDPTPVGKRVFEEIGTTRSGLIIAQDTEGGLYKLEEL